MFSNSSQYLLSACILWGLIISIIQNLTIFVKFVQGLFSLRQRNIERNVLKFIAIFVICMYSLGSGNKHHSKSYYFRKICTGSFFS